MRKVLLAVLAGTFASALALPALADCAGKVHSAQGPTTSAPATSTASDNQTVVKPKG